MKKILLVFIVAVFLTSCGSVVETVQEDVAPEYEMDYSYLALGDSYTIGEGVAVAERWPVQLTNNLRDRGYKVAPPKIIAQTGWTSRNLFKAMEQELNYTRKFDLVSILIGVNDQYQGKSIREYEEDLRQVFRMALNYSKTREHGVFALSIPDYGVTPFAGEKAEEISAEIAEFNAVFRRVAEEYGVDFYNITPVSREAARDPGLLVEDELHPSGRMYRYWVEEIIDEITQKLPN
ncbi:SGNH/GDSL hydrolase family protein [Salegentibacter sediminis]|uniref:SGNH/GDSL hydrolase family protein n=1 Tax=Salegentibacter sediminis TaxID=1930251 RepID=UPI0009BD1510|nr:SGNH/GDSL hydrolase family protein [Salegentibacter sediminis]